MSQWIRINPAEDAAFEGWLALPPAGHGPGLLLLQEAFGVNPHIRAVAAQYAQSGLVVLAPDMYWRQRPHIELGYEGQDLQQFPVLMQGMDPALTQQDLRASVAALRARAEVRGRIGAMGYCMGGRLAYVVAAIADVDAACAYYGGGIQDQLELADQIRVPMLFHYAGADAYIPPEAVADVAAAFAGKPAQIFTYPGVDHGFNCDARGSYDPQAAMLAQGRTLQFFAETLFG